MPATRPATLWIKSRRCEANTCLEATLAGETILVRNSTDPSGSMLAFTHAEWVAFVGGVRDGDFDFGLVDEKPTVAR